MVRSYKFGVSMKSLFSLLFLVLFQGQALADASSCNSIKDPDKKITVWPWPRSRSVIATPSGVRPEELLPAQVKEQESYCYSIKSSDTRTSVWHVALIINARLHPCASPMAARSLSCHSPRRCSLACTSAARYLCRSCGVSSLWYLQ